MTRRVPPGFLWGAATSAAQIEGGIDRDRRGPSIWDAFAAEPGRIADGTTPTVAADHRARMADDVALMARLGLDAYRFSVAWPRVQPTGSGPFSADGLAFYSALVDQLLAVGIEPVLTLYHWDLPLALSDSGGWPERATAERFATYAGVVAAALGDRVRRWVTINEPWCSSMLGYGSGVHAPGVIDAAAAVAASHHLLLAHGMAVQALRAELSPNADHEISLSLNPYPVVPVTDSDLDVDAARRVDGVANRLWYDAVLQGRYPDDVLEDFSGVSDLAHVRDGDLAVIAGPIDALGLNYYRRHHVRHTPGASAAPPWSTWPGSPDIELVTPPGPTTASGWAVEPDGLVESLTAVHRSYPVPPIYVHENGAAYHDEVDADGSVDDRDREEFLEAHVDATLLAVAAGVDVRGYFVWSLLDNFEWAEGHGKRFGVVFVDFDTQRRTVKRSGHWYARRARSPD